jgi:pimeloyl-ACP methyl ester carboxylesterase
MTERIAYDELALFHENAEEYGIPWTGPPVVARTAVEVDRPSGRAVSALLWGTDSPEIVFVHGGAQNAHTWDTVALALGRPALAVDLPGHGHSGWRDDLAYSPMTNAEDIAVAIEHLAPSAAVVVGMSLGGLTSIALAARRPDLVRKLILVDVTPGVDRGKAKAILDFVNGPQTFPSFDDIMKRTIEHNPTRTEASLRRGILHNAHQLDDGSWAWRYDRRHRGGEGEGDVVDAIATNPLWDDLSSLAMPILLLRGSLSPVVDDNDVAEVKRRQPTAEVVVVDGAGHSIQGDKPLELAALITGFAFNR